MTLHFPHLRVQNSSIKKLRKIHELRTQRWKVQRPRGNVDLLSVLRWHGIFHGRFLPNPSVSDRRNVHCAAVPGRVDEFRRTSLSVLPDDHRSCQMNRHCVTRCVTLIAETSRVRDNSIGLIAQRFQLRFTRQPHKSSLTAVLRAEDHCWGWPSEELVGRVSQFQEAEYQLVPCDRSSFVHLPAIYYWSASIPRAACFLTLIVRRVIEKFYLHGDEN